MRLTAEEATELKRLTLNLLNFIEDEEDIEDALDWLIEQALSE